MSTFQQAVARFGVRTFDLPVRLGFGQEQERFVVRRIQAFSSLDCFSIEAISMLIFSGVNFRCGSVAKRLSGQKRIARFLRQSGTLLKGSKCLRMLLLRRE